MSKKPAMVRVTGSVPSDLNDWLDAQPIPKSTLILLALEQYRYQKDSLSALQAVGRVSENESVIKTWNTGK